MKKLWIDATAQQRRLIVKAAAAMKRAYAPYSHFKVGAAIEAADGSIFTGCNIEDAAYSTTCCAERVALFKAVSEGKRVFRSIAVIASGKKPCPPCGTCRQALVEFMRDMEVVMANTRGAVKISSLKQLLPESFHSLR